MGTGHPCVLKPRMPIDIKKSTRITKKRFYKKVYLRALEDLQKLGIADHRLDQETAELSRVQKDLDRARVEINALREKLRVTESHNALLKEAYNGVSEKCECLEERLEVVEEHRELFMKSWLFGKPLP